MAWISAQEAVERIAPLDDPRSIDKAALTGPLGGFWRYRVAIAG